MTTRRIFLQHALASGVLVSCGAGQGAAQDRYDQAALLAFPYPGAVTLVHIGDLRGVTQPHFMRPAEVRVAPGAERDRVPHLTGEALRIRYGVGALTQMDAAMTHDGFDALAQQYGPMGGQAHLRALVQAIVAEQPGAVVIGAHTLAPLVPQGLPDGPEIITRGGARLALFRNPPADLEVLLAQITAVQAAGPVITVLVSQAGFAADREIAYAIKGIDIILSEGDGFALPEPEMVGTTRIIASGTQGRFVSRVGLYITDGAISAFQYRLIPVFADLITPVGGQMRPAQMALGTAAQTLYRRGTFDSTWDNLLGAVMCAQVGADIAFVPPGGVDVSVLAGTPITQDHLRIVCGGARITALEMTGAEVKNVLERAAAETFAPDPFARQHVEMPRVKGASYTIDIIEKSGARLSQVMLADGAPLQADKRYRVAALGVEGTPLYEAATTYITQHQNVVVQPASITLLSPG